MPERMVAELAEVACGVPSGSLGWWWGAMRFFWVAAMRFLWVATMRFSWVVVGCHTVLLGGSAIKIKKKRIRFSWCLMR